MSLYWDWLATLVYPALFGLFGIYAVLAAVGRCIIVGRRQCVALFVLGSVVCGSLALTTGRYALDVHEWARPLARVASAGIVGILLVELVRELRRMRRLGR
jgi:hypothetical protein